MNKNSIVFSFRRKQITIKVREQLEYKEIIGTLKKKMPEVRRLYKNIEPSTIMVMGLDFTEREEKGISKLLSKYFSAQVEFSAVEKLGLYGIRKAFNKEIATSETTFYRHSLRSGQKIEFKGSIVVLGDVHYGAEVIAGENIVVLGNLRGLAHAGASGNKEAIISAGLIDTTQIRISNIVRECEKSEFENTIIKTNAYLDKNDNIVIE